MAKIQFVKANRKNFEAEPGEVLMKALLKNQIPVASSCKGEGVCAKCRLMILSGSENVSPVSDLEKILVQKNKYPPGTRISCQVTITGGSGTVVTVDTGYW